MLANRKGTFRAEVIDKGISESKSKLLQAVIRYRLLEEAINGEWQPCDSEGLEINSYYNLVKRDGSLNEVSIDTLKTTFGWDGRDPFWLQDNNLPCCQIILDFEEYNGKTNLRVQYTNHYDFEGGGIHKADDSFKQSVNSQLGSKFRALAGPAPVSHLRPTNAPPSRSPVAEPVAQASAPPTQSATAVADPPAQSQGTPESIPDANPNVSTMDDAWAAFCEACPSTGHRNTEWFRITTQRKPDIEQMTPEDWHWMKTEGVNQILPF